VPPAFGLVNNKQSAVANYFSSVMASLTSSAASSVALAAMPVSALSFNRRTGGSSGQYSGIHAFCFGFELFK
jgi:hypothetical protein